MKLYHLISFSQEHMEGWEALDKREKDYVEAVDGMTKEERNAYRKTLPPHVPEQRINLGKAYRGTWTDLDELLKIIDNSTDPYGICECYYEYLLIETSETNQVDPWVDEEMWFKSEHNSEDGTIKWNKIPKPEYLQRMCNFL